MERLASRFGMVRRAAIDFAIGGFVFAILAVGMSVDRTGNAGAFLSVAQFAPSYAHASDYRPKQKNAHVWARTDRDSIAMSQRARARTSGGHLASQAVFARTDQSAAMVMLGIIFSTVFAFNLAFFRHLHIVYGTRRHGFLSNRPGVRGR